MSFNCLPGYISVPSIFPNSRHLNDNQDTFLVVKSLRLWNLRLARQVAVGKNCVLLWWLLSQLLSGSPGSVSEQRNSIMGIRMPAFMLQLCLRFPQRPQNHDNKNPKDLRIHFRELLPFTNLIGFLEAC